MMKEFPYRVKLVMKYLNEMGVNFEMESYKPGNHVLYRIVKLGKNGSRTPISPYLTRKEMIRWCEGFIAYPTVCDGENPIV